MRRALLHLCLLLALAACVETVPAAAPPAIRAPLPDTAARTRFETVVARMEPVIERECLRLRAATNCDFRIVVDPRPDLPPNAFQTLDRSGRPILAFTLALIGDVRNADELAFAMGHEAAHHIAAHIPRRQEDALTGALILGVLAAASGADPEGVREASDLGGRVGALRYAKAYELEADRLGTILAWEAGYDPLVGAAYFERLPDPGNAFLGTHPPNAARIATVRQTLATLR